MSADPYGNENLISRFGKGVYTGTSKPSLLKYGMESC